MSSAAEESKPSQPARTWEAADYKAALANLGRIQEQLDGLRSTIPSLAGPLLRPQTSKAHMFADIKKAATQSVDDIQTFKEDWNSAMTQEAFARSKESQEANGDLSKAKDVPAYGWAG